ncbi:ABC transporter substrate-binding protein [Herpetosiphon sp. NSE202]|uniref:ABC transporter substrate-binding protein n=1 Tax=Herpetosiphon sp. NSE202 TaxID=3351349 RepID=UPI00362C238A
MQRFLALIGLVSMLAACGSSAATQAPTTAPTTAAAATATTTPEATAAATEAAAEATTAPADTADTRTIKHVMGETTITGVPQKVVVLEWVYVENLLALGVQPAGVADIEGYNKWVDVPVELGPAAVDVGTRGEANLETIASIKPDLIITLQYDAEKNYAQYSAIAPTLVFNAYPESGDQYTEMIETFNTIADVLGKTEEAKAVLSKMEQTYAEAKQTLAAAGFENAPYVLAQAYTSNSAAEIRLFTDNSMIAKLIAKTGLKNAWTDSTFQVYGFSTVGSEALAGLGDIHFMYVVADDDNPFASGAIKPFWDSLDFVKKGQAYPLGGDVWFFGGPLSAEVLAERVVKSLTKQ